MGMYLATNPHNGLSIKWYAKNELEEAKKIAYTLADPLSVIVTHLKKIIKKHAAEIFDPAQALADPMLQALLTLKR